MSSVWELGERRIAAPVPRPRLCLGRFGAELSPAAELLAGVGGRSTAVSRTSVPGRAESPLGWEAL